MFTDYVSNKLRVWSTNSHKELVFRCQWSMCAKNCFYGRMNCVIEKSFLRSFFVKCYIHIINVYQIQFPKPRLWIDMSSFTAGTLNRKSRKYNGDEYCIRLWHSCFFVLIANNETRKAHLNRTVKTLSSYFNVGITICTSCERGI